MNNGTILIGGSGHIEYLREISSSFTPADPVTGNWKRYFRGTGLYVEEDTAFRQYRIRLRRVVKQSGNVTLVDPTHDTVQVNAGSGAVTITLPDPADLTYGNNMKILTIQKWDDSANAVIIDATSGFNVNFAQRYILTRQYESITLIPLVDDSEEATDWIVESSAQGAGILSDLATKGTTAVITEENLNTVTLPAHWLNGNFRGIDLEAFGSFANNANGKTIRLYFGATVLVTNDITTTPQNLKWVLRARIYRTGVSTQRAIGEGSVGANLQSVSYTTPNQTETSAITVKATGQNGVATANDIVCEGLTIRPMPG